MTQDYKDTLLKYLTGNLSKNSGTNIPSFDTNVYADGTALHNALTSAFQYGFMQNGIIQCKNANGEYNGFTILYGAYYRNNDHDYETARGYIVLLDSNYNVAQIIKQYSSGTYCGIFMKLQVANDGTLYGLDYYNNQNRLIILNNPSLKLASQSNYQLQLRISYYLQGNVASMSHTGRGFTYVLDKDPNSGNYLMGATDPNNGFEALTRLKINVGSSNEWIDYSYSKPTPNASNFQNILYVYVNWQEELPYIYAYNDYWGYTSGGDLRNVMYLGTNNGGTTISNTSLFDVLSSLWSGYSDYELGGSALTIIGTNNFYYACAIGIEDWDTNDTDCTIKIVHYNNGSITECYKSNVLCTSVREQPITPFYDISLFNINGTICCNYIFMYSETATRQNMSVEAVLITNNDESVANGVGMITYADYTSFYLFNLVNQYDLYKFVLVFNDFETGWSIISSNIVYNKNYYNGSEYENVNSLSPKHCILYNNGGKIFARGLYNKVVSGYTTEAVVQIPNTMLNDIQITSNELLSETNLTMIEDTDTIEKNVYETVYLNYIDIINIENRNTQDYIQNPVGATRVNNSISSVFDYDNMKIGKYRVNYHDNTILVGNIATPTIQNGVATYNITVYTGKQIDSIDLLSLDMNTIYQTIDTSSFELNKLYKLSQDVYVD